MQKLFIRNIRGLIVCIAGVVMMLMFTACAGIASTGNGTSMTITGSITSVDTTNHSVTLNVNGQNLTVNGLSDQQAAALKSQTNKTYSVQVTQNSDGSYTINPGANPLASNGSTPGIETQTPSTTGNNEPSTPNAAGNLAFIGKVQNASTNMVAVSMPDGQVLTLSIVSGQTDLSSFNGAPLTSGQMIKVKANANPDGSFMATELKPTDSGDLKDQNTVDYQGVTLNAVSPDNHLNIKVGGKSFSFTITPGTTDLGDFNNNAQSIGSNQPIKVTVQFQGTNGTVLKVANASN